MSRRDGVFVLHPSTDRQYSPEAIPNDPGLELGWLSLKMASDRPTKSEYKNDQKGSEMLNAAKIGKKHDQIQDAKM